MVVFLSVNHFTIIPQPTLKKWVFYFVYKKNVYICRNKLNLKIMTKQEAIAKAYGEHWEKVKDLVDVNGLIVFHNYKYLKLFDYLEMVAYDSRGVFWIPKSLIGIQDNNGWIKIESENDLPKDEKIQYHSGWFENGKLSNYQIRTFLEVINQIKRFNAVNVYQPIIKPQPPIY